MKIGRRDVLAAGALAALPRFAIAQTVPVLQTMRSTSRSWLWLAEDYGTAGGFFDKAGVKVVSNASNRGTNIASLAGSGVDIVLGDPGEVLNAKAHGFAVTSFLQTVGKYGSHVLVKQAVLQKAGVTEASPVAAKIAALKGLRMGTTGPGAAPDTLIRWLAIQGKLDPNHDLRLVQIQGGGPGMIAGLQQNVIDGFCLSSPTADLAIADAGSGYLFNMVRNPPPYFDSFCYIIASTSAEVLKARREALVRYASGIALTLRSIRTEPDRFKAFAIPFLQLDPAIAQDAFANNATMYFADPVPEASLFSKNVDVIDTANRSAGGEVLPAGTSFASIYDTSIAAEAMKRI